MFHHLLLCDLAKLFPPTHTVWEFLLLPPFALSSDHYPIDRTSFTIWWIGLHISSAIRNFMVSCQSLSRWACTPAIILLVNELFGQPSCGKLWILYWFTLQKWTHWRTICMLITFSLNTCANCWWMLLAVVFGAFDHKNRITEHGCKCAY